MKCSYCGHEIEDGNIYCGRCGKPIQMVPDYNMLEGDVLPSIVSDAGKDESQTPEGEGASSSSTESGRGGKRSALKIFFIIAIIICAIVTFTCIFMYTRSAGFLIAQGNRAFDSKDYDAALSYYRSAEETAREADIELQLSMGLSALYLNDIPEAEERLEYVLSEDPENEEAFRALCGIYIQQGNYEGLDRLSLSAITDEQKKSIREFYVSPVTFSEESGAFDEDITVSIGSQDDNVSIYYTVDGSEPDLYTGTLYSSPVEISDGITVLKARAISEDNVKGPVVSAEYEVAYSHPDYPIVSPDGGTFYEPAAITITSVNDGDSIYYSWDGSDPTVNSKLYEKPLQVPEGNHVLSVIAVNSHGLSSDVLKCNFVYMPRGDEDVPVPEDTAPEAAPSEGSE